MKRTSVGPTRALLATAVSIIAVVTGLTAAAQPPAPRRQKQILVLYSLRPDAQLVTIADRELPRTLAHGLGGGVDYYSEFIDQGRFEEPEYVAALRDFMRAKYKARRFDLVIAIGDVPIEFVEHYRHEELFTGPLIFFATNGSLSRPANSTGVIAETNFRDTLTLAADLQPDTRNVFVIAGAPATDRAFERSARLQFVSFGSRFAFTYLSGLPATVLEERVSHLPPHSLVYFLIVQRDSAGNSFVPLEYLDRVTAVSNAPVYSWVDSALDHGIVGGSLKDQLAEVRAVAALARRVLGGEKADSIPIVSLDLNVTQVDWRQLRRWRISPARVPAGTIVRFREPSAWERYRTFILEAVALLLAQSALIAGLLVQRARRRAAEDQTNRSRSALLRSYERIRDLGGRLLKAQERERSRIARELHDDISQQVAILTIDLELLRTAEAGERDELRAGTLTRAHQIARSLHDLSHRLHPTRLRLLGLVPALEALRQELSLAEVTVAFTHEGVPSRLSPDLSLCLYRIVQEGLQNAMKYSKARAISVHVSAGSGGLTLTIGDDGVGFDVNSAWGRGVGLMSMQERLEPFGASLEIHSAPGAGTTLLISVPLAVAESTLMVAV